jgi:U4/U6.U5 tri-snRNP-associated protein 3
MDLDKPLMDSSGKTTATGKAPGRAEEQQEDEDSDTALLRALMGFTVFKTTKNQKVPGNNIYGVRKEKKTEYRQYMNRVGGFNRPLSPTR